MRDPIELNLNKTLGAVLQAGLNVDPIKIVIASYLEGRNLEGDWKIEITGARLVPTGEANDVPKEVTK